MPRFRLLCFVSLLAALIMNSLVEVALAATLVQDGQNRSTIVMSPSALPATREAVEDLQYYLAQMTGAQVPVVDDPQQAQSPVILWIGQHDGLAAHFPDADLNLTRHEQILIAVRGNHVLVMGRDVAVNGVTLEAGTSQAIYTFLEKHLDIRWLWPGELGQDVPQQSTLTLPDQVFVHASPLRQRLLRYRNGHSQGLASFPQQPVPEQIKAASQRLDQQADQWYRRQRSTHYRLMQAGHAFVDWRKRFGESHPEWFALQPDGTRDPFPRPGYDKLCISNPQVIQHWIDHAAAAFEQTPHRLAISASPNDSGYAGYCVCENCQAWDAAAGPTTSLRWKGLDQEHVALTDRYGRWWNLLARGLKQRVPGRDAYVAVWAYGAYRTPPVEVQLEDNILVGYVGSMGHTNKQAWQHDREIWANWAAMTDNLVWRPNLFHGQWGMPVVAPRRAAADFAFMADHNLMGLDVDSVFHHWATQGLQYYVLSQLAWDPYLDIEALLSDYMTRAFGPQAAPYMQTYFDELEQAYHELSERTIDLHRTEAVLHFPLVYHAQRRARWHELIEQARQAVAGPRADRYRQRVAFAAVGLTFIDKQVAAIDAMTNLRTGRGQVREMVEQAFSATDQRDALLMSQVDDFALNTVGAYHTIHHRHMRSYLGPPDDAFKAVLSADPRQQALPLEWAFRLDRSNEGIAQRWFDPAVADTLTWGRLNVTSPWGEQLLSDDPDDPGFLQYLGVAWYRTTVQAQPAQPGERVWLHVGAIDESAWVYVNGHLAGEQVYAELGDSDAWKKPRRFDVTDYLTAGDNHVAIRVESLVGQGGITRPASLHRLPMNLVAQGNLPDGSQTLSRWIVRDSSTGTDVEVPMTTEPGQYVGESSVRVRVAPGQRISLRRGSTQPLEPGKTYEVLVRYRQRLDQQLSPGAKPLRFRLIATPREGEAQGRDRLWLDAPAGNVEEWSYLSGLFTAERDYHRFSVTLFLWEAGDYIIDEVIVRPHEL